jgi:hypothetical protein
MFLSQKPSGWGHEALQYSRDEPLSQILSSRYKPGKAFKGYPLPAFGFPACLVYSNTMCFYRKFYFHISYYPLRKV